jgi:hypothetical protein
MCSAAPKFSKASPSASLWDMLSVYRVVLRASGIADAFTGSSASQQREGASDEDLIDLTEIGSSQGSTSAPKLPSSTSTDGTLEKSRIGSIVTQLTESVQACAQYQRLAEEIIDIDSLSKKNRQNYMHRIATHSKWIQVRPTFNANLAEFSAELEQTWQLMLVELENARQMLTASTSASASSSGGSGTSSKNGPKSKKRDASEMVTTSQIQLEYNHVHGFHLRVTKKEETKAMKILKTKTSVTVLASLKSGTLFLTKKVSNSCNCSIQLTFLIV